VEVCHAAGDTEQLQDKVTHTRGEEEASEEDDLHQPGQVKLWLVRFHCIQDSTHDIVRVKNAEQALSPHTVKHTCVDVKGAHNRCVNPVVSAGAKILTETFVEPKRCGLTSCVICQFSGRTRGSAAGNVNYMTLVLRYHLVEECLGHPYQRQESSHETHAPQPHPSTPTLCDR